MGPVRAVIAVLAVLTGAMIPSQGAWGASESSSTARSAAVTTGGISGTTTVASTGRRVGGITVLVYGADLGYLASAISGPTGTFQVLGLPAATGDIVCFDGSTVITGTGYDSQCYNGVSWDPTALPPSGGTPVSVTAGTTTPGIDAKLLPAGAISGRVTARKGGSGIANVTVDVFDAAGAHLASDVTASNGAFEVKGLTPTTGVDGDTVCFDASTVNSGTGYSSQCFKSTPWEPSPFPPTGATGIAVTSGTLKRAINAVLATGGEIEGRVIAATTKAGVGKVTVDVFDSSGLLLGSAATSSLGKYLIAGLPTNGTGDTVCFDASAVTTGTGYSSQCYNGVDWDSANVPPLNLKPVKVTAGFTTAGINASLAPGGFVMPSQL